MLEMDVERTEKFAKNEKLEEVLKELNTKMMKLQLEVNQEYTQPQYPVLQIVGCPRSGTTLLMQWLAGLGLFAYPTNLCSRFYGAPYIGARIQQALVEYDTRNEIFAAEKEPSFRSELGKTKGPLEPNEFWYFWRRFFSFGEIQVLSQDQLLQVDTARFTAELAAFEAALGKPVAMKALILNWHIPFLNSMFDKALFLYIKRNPVYNAQSLLVSRKKFFNSYEKWYSFKPPEYPELVKKTPFDQVAGQVYYTNKAVAQGLKDIPAERVLECDYQQFCDSPRTLFEQILQRFAKMDFKPDWKYQGPDSFDPTDKMTIPRKDFDRIVKAYADISGESPAV